MKARVNLEVPLIEVAVMAELALWQTRPELQLLCLGAQTTGRLDDTVVERTLPGLTPRGRDNLKRHVEYIRLVDSRGALTATGARCAQTGEAPSWEQGCYSLLVADHPILGGPLFVDFKRMSDSQDRDFDSLEELPGWFKPDTNRIFETQLQRGRRFSLAPLLTPQGASVKCRTWDRGFARLQWEIEPISGNNSWTLIGETGGAWSVSGEVDAGRLQGLMVDWDKRWDQASGHIKLDFDGKVSADGTDSFQRDQIYPRCAIRELAPTCEVRVEGVPIAPLNQRAAERWALEMASRRVAKADRFLSTQDWDELWKGAVKAIPRTSGVTEPKQEVFDKSDKSAVSTRTRWLVAAARDIGMEV